MEEKRVKQLLQEYSEAPSGRREIHLKKWREKEAELQENGGKRTSRVFRSPYFIGALVSLLIIAVVLPVVLVYAGNAKQYSSVEYYSEDDVVYRDIDSIEAYNEKYDTHVKELTESHSLFGAQDIVSEKTGKSLGLSAQLVLNDGVILEADFKAYVTPAQAMSSKEEFEELPNQVEIDGYLICYKTFCSEQGDYVYYISFDTLYADYRVRVICFEETDIHTIYSHLFP